MRFLLVFTLEILLFLLDPYDLDFLHQYFSASQSIGEHPLLVQYCTVFCFPLSIALLAEEEEEDEEDFLREVCDVCLPYPPVRS